MFLHTAEAFRTAEPVRRATTIGLDRTRLPLAGRIALPKRPALGAIDAAALVETEQGWKRIADLTPGMAIHTRDGGLQRLDAVSLMPRLPVAATRLVRIPGGALGNCGPLSLTPETQLLIRSQVAEEVLGVPEVLVPAAALEGWRGIRCEAAGHHGRPVAMLRFARDEIVWLNSGLQVLCGRNGGYLTRLDLDRARSLIALEGADLAQCRLAA